MSHTKTRFHKATSVCLIIQQARPKGTYRGTLLVTKGWVNHELTLPRDHHHLFMRCQTQWVKTGIGRCAATIIFLPLFLSKHVNRCHWGALCHPLPLWPSVISLVWAPCRSEWEGIQLMSSWWSYSPTQPTHSPCSPCMESQRVNHWPSRELPVCSQLITSWFPEAGIGYWYLEVALCSWS